MDIGTQQSRGKFSHRFNEDTGRMEVTFDSRFEHTDWAQFEETFGAYMNRWDLTWVFDFSRLRWINSLMLGLILAFREHLNLHRSDLQLSVRGDSDIARLMRHCQIDRVMPVIEC